MPMTTETTLRDHLLYLLKGDGAHVEFDAAIKDLPLKLQGTRPEGAAHSAWELLEHIRITQRDVLDSIRNANHVSPEFPSGYWPQKKAPTNGQDWDRSAEAFRWDLDELLKLVSSTNTDPLAPLHGDNTQSVFRKIAMLADHTSYHLGQLVLVRRLLGAWQ